MTCYDRFEVERISYNERQEIDGLAIINTKTRKRVFSWQKGQNVNLPAEEPKATQSASTPVKKDFVPTCSNCGKEIDERVHDYSVKKYGKPLCRTCQR
jgi:hypothetical protein